MRFKAVGPVANCCLQDLAVTETLVIVDPDKVDLGVDHTREQKFASALYVAIRFNLPAQVEMIDSPVVQQGVMLTRLARLLACVGPEGFPLFSKLDDLEHSGMRGNLG